MTKAPDHTPGPWEACNMVHEEGRPMTPEELGEYVCNSVKLSPETRFLFISGDNGDGDVDVCHIGNGPRGPANARLIAAAPELLEALERQAENMAFILNHATLPDQWYERFTSDLDDDRAALSKAKGEG